LRLATCVRGDGGDAGAEGPRLIGGIVLSTLVTLVLVPVFYVLVERLRGGTGLLLKSPKA
jgi:hypothetical protein